MRTQRVDDFARLLTGVEDMLEDRRRSYARLGLDAPTWLGHPPSVPSPVMGTR